jgi:thioesterase domain-containing protein
MNEIVSRKPAHLLGHSLGGWIVFDMALRFLAAGRTVASLTILDSEVPGQDTIQDYSNTDITMAWLETFEHDLGRPVRIQRSNLEGCNQDEQLKLIHRKS